MFEKRERTVTGKARIQSDKSKQNNNAKQAKQAHVQTAALMVLVLLIQQMEARDASVTACTE